MFIPFTYITQFFLWYIAGTTMFFATVGDMSSTTRFTLWCNAFTFSALGFTFGFLRETNRLQKRTAKINEETAALTQKYAKYYSHE